jgi:hypothetical protein
MDRDVHHRGFGRDDGFPLSISRIRRIIDGPTSSPIRAKVLPLGLLAALARAKTFVDMARCGEKMLDHAPVPTISCRCARA